MTNHLQDDALKLLAEKLWNNRDLVDIRTTPYPECNETVFLDGKIVVSKTSGTSIYTEHAIHDEKGDVIMRVTERDSKVIKQVVSVIQAYRMIQDIQGRNDIEVTARPRKMFGFWMKLFSNFFDVSDEVPEFTPDLCYTQLVDDLISQITIQDIHEPKRETIMVGDIAVFYWNNFASLYQYGIDLPYEEGRRLAEAIQVKRASMVAQNV